MSEHQTRTRNKILDRSVRADHLLTIPELAERLRSTHAAAHAQDQMGSWGIS